MIVDSNAAYERSMKDKAVVNHVVDQQKAIQAGRAGTVHPYTQLVRTMLVEAEKILSKRLKPHRGKSNTGELALKQTGLDLKTVCAIAARTVVDGVVMGQRIQRITSQVGSHIEDEVRTRELKKREPLLWKNLEKQWDDRGSQDYKAKRMLVMSALAKTHSEEQWIPWDAETKAALGILVVDALFQAGLVERVSVPSGKRFVKHELLCFPAEVEDALSRADEAASALLKPWYKPMLESPLPWTSPTSGGYKILPGKLVKMRGKDELARFESADMPKVYAAVNAVQATPWKINEDILVVVEELHRLRTSGVAGLPIIVENERPVRPYDIPFDVPLKELPEEDQARLKVYLKEKRVWHNETAKRTSKNVQSLQIMEVAKELRAAPAIYFPHTLDYRGRMYPAPLQLNPQGNDLAKGLLTFAGGRPLGEMGGFWLAVHGANTWGKDKGPLTERVDWVLEHQREIQECAADPLSNRWWTEADGGSKPFQFLAWCLEWDAYLKSGESPAFVSHLPVSVDGACNGIQHFSAMLRDADGARATNLTSDPVQHDVYAEVAEEVNNLIRTSRHDSEHDREMAGIWLNFGVDRKVVKRPVMTTPYGATAIGMKEMVMEDTIAKNPQAYFGTQPWQAAQWLAGKIDEAIGTKLVAARQAMTFLQELASALTQEELPVAWTTPAGFPVVQKLVHQDRFLINTKLLGRIMLQFATTGNKLNGKKQRSSIAPNFVHSYDAAHLQLTVVEMEKQLGRSLSWAVVHDSFGTHAGDAETLGRVLREQFVEMYNTEDSPLDRLLDRSLQYVPVGTMLPSAPSRGTFDIQEVLQAEFFFA